MKPLTIRPARTAALAALLCVPLASWAPLSAGVNLSPPNVFLLAFLAAVAYTSARRMRLRLNGGRAAAALFAALAFWIVLTEPGGGAVTALGAMVFAVPGAYLARRGRSWETAVLVGMAVAALVGLGHYIGVVPTFAFERPSGAGRTLFGVVFDAGHTGLIPARGDYGIWGVLALMVAVRWWVEGRRRVMTWVAAGIIVAALAVAQSRSTWLAVTTFLGVAAVAHIAMRRRANERLLLTVTAIVLTTVVAVGAAATGTLGRTAQGIVAVAPASVTYRLQANDVAFSRIAERPVFGAGAAARWSGETDGSGHIVHNTPLALGVVYGVPAALLFLAHWLWIAGRHAKRAFLRGGYRHALWAGALAAIMVEMLLFSGAGSKFYWAATGLAVGEYSRLRRLED